MRLDIDNVSHSYGDLTVLSNISVSVPSGRILAIVGPSGSGKSTLLRIIGGLESPDAGQVQLMGSTPPGCINPLTFVFQDFALLPWRTVRGNVEFPLERKGLTKAQRCDLVDDALHRTNLSAFADALPKQLSGGMRQRVGIARAMVVRPAVLIMDEPLSALDAQTRELLLIDIAQLSAKEGFTGVYVTHNLVEAIRLGHTVMVLSRRPGAVKALITIDTPLLERRSDGPELQAQSAHIWHLLREDALEAERELV
ncbi:ABC transporter ATP-binding protein [Variovorax paradoxus]|jgi:NitT/TauT family transport system ATP-binding protein|uniref:Sulfate/thiosulfate import ATP-binding protein CysA n=1 Tax=Variovorax paradoxus TaxID=34073 RepID=A0A679JG05_VARPD|nr:Sulfate/thiosulfate import ATP-binding protein CysA [Variovorax paradoxus]